MFGRNWHASTELPQHVRGATRDERQGEGRAEKKKFSYGETLDSWCLWGPELWLLPNKLSNRGSPTHRPGIHLLAPWWTMNKHFLRQEEAMKNEAQMIQQTVQLDPEDRNCHMETIWGRSPTVERRRRALVRKRQKDLQHLRQGRRRQERPSSDEDAILKNTWEGQPESRSS